MEEASEVDCLLYQSESCAGRERGLRFGLEQALLSPSGTLLLAQQTQAGHAGAPGKVALASPSSYLPMVL